MTTTVLREQTPPRSAVIGVPAVDVPAIDVPRIAVSGRLAAPAPSWQLTTDVLVIGSGVAGLSVLRGLAGSGLRMHLVTKATLEAGSTRWAQGGIARATADLNDADLHLHDTLVAGAGLCDPAAVRTLVDQGPDAVQALAAAGARFDLGPDGLVAQTREGGHSRARIVHSGGDATGQEVQRALQATIAAEVTVHEHAFLLELLRADDGSVAGAVIALVDAAGGCRSTGRVHARATVLATGGLGQVFADTTNPSVATGDGVAAALRAGAEVADLEFVQFHPTVLFSPGPHGATSSRRLLISEAVRGEGAVLVDADGEPVMAGTHPLADLAPRDVVSATMAAAMAVAGVNHLYLDARRLGERTLLRRFPTIVAGCRAAGVDPVSAPIPVVPAAHYSCGGIRADLSGRTTLPGLFAVGEVACTGVHGANRLASNSLLEGLVAGRRLADLLLDALPAMAAAASVTAAPHAATGVDPGVRPALTRAMDSAAGVLRTPTGLAGLAGLLAASAPSVGARSRTAAGPGAAHRCSWEATNLHTVMAAIVGAAIRRQESRGCHRRADRPETRQVWQRHLVSSIEVDLDLGTTITQEVRP